MFVRFYDGEHLEVPVKKDNRIIDYTLIGQQLPKLFELISNRRIYMKHVPESRKDALYVTNGRYVMAVAGFEAQHQKMKRVDSQVQTLAHEQREEAKAELIWLLERKLESKKGKEHQQKVRRLYKRIIAHLNSDNTSLEYRLEDSFEENWSIMSRFLIHLYDDLNGVRVDPSLLSERITEHRNKFAHGDLDFETHELFILDLLSIEWLYYAMVLEELDMSEQNIYGSINKLFNRRLESYKRICDDDCFQEK